MQTPQIVNTNAISTTLPVLPVRMVSRENILDTIDTMITDASLVVVDGEDGIGKTTVLSEYARKRPDDTISLFLGFGARWLSDIDLITVEIGQQVQWILSDNPAPLPSSFSERHLRRLIFDLSRRARWRQSPYVFVIDGINEVSHDNPDCVNALTAALPFGMPGFKFVVSPGFPEDALEKGVHNRLRVVPFILDESVRYLEDLVHDRTRVHELNKLCRGVPGNLAIVRRLLLSGIPVEDLIENAPSKLQDLFEFEWSKVVPLTEPQRLFLAIIALDRNPRTPPSLAALSGLNLTEAEELIRRCTFLEVDASKNCCDFVSDAIRRFVAQKLAAERSKVLDAIIRDLSKSSDSVDALLQLPAYLSEGRRYEELLEVLSPEHFETLAERARSLSAIRQSNLAGFRAAQALRRDDDIFKFGLQSAAFREIAATDVGRAELAAHLAMNDRSGALTLAQSADLKEDRLQLLAMVAEGEAASGGAPDESILAEIRELYSSIEPITLGERALEIAADILPTAPDIAVDLIQRATDVESGTDALDWAFTRVSLTAIARANTTSSAPIASSINHLVEHIRDPKVQTASLTAGLLLKDASAAEVINHLETVSSVSDKLRLLRTWIPAHRESSDAIEAAIWGIRTAIRSTDYLLECRTARQLATALPYARDTVLVREFIGLADGQKTNLRQSGPTEEFIRLQLLLARGERHINSEAARNRALEVYWHLAAETDVAIQSDGLARLKSALPDIDPDRRLESDEGLHTLVGSDLDKSLSQLLSVTADHYQAVRGAIRAVARKDFAAAIAIAGSLNVKPRRDQALLAAISTAAAGRLEGAAVDQVVAALSKINEVALRGKAVTSLVEALHKMQPEVRVPLAKSLTPYLTDIDEPREQVHVITTLYVLLSKEPASSLLNHLFEKLNIALDAIDAGWRKVETTFNVAKELAVADASVARDFVKSAEEYRKESHFESWRTAATCWYATLLAVRAFRGLVRLDTATENDIASITSAIELFPALTDRIMLWRDLAHIWFLEGQPNNGRNVVHARILPTLEEENARNRNVGQQLTANTAAVLYLSHKITALERIALLTPEFRDRAYIRICMSILDKVVGDDPRQIEDDQHEFSYDEAVDLIELLPLFDSDAAAYTIVRSIASTCGSKSNRARYKEEQRADIAKRLISTCNAIFPRKPFITHDGYKLAARSQVNKVRSGVNAAEWQQLIAQSEAIPNESDRAYVLAIIASSMASKFDHMRQAALVEAEQITDRIPVAVERLDLYEKLVNETRQWDRPNCKRILTKAMRMAWTLEANSSKNIERRLLDIAYRVDPEFASGLGKLLDKDEARLTSKQVIERRKRIVEIRQLLSEGKIPMRVDEDERAEVSTAAWEQLRALNSKRINPVRLADASKWLSVAADMPMSDAFPILSWLTENAVQSTENKKSSHVRRAFSSAVDTARLIRRVSASGGADFRLTDGTEYASGELIRAGEAIKVVELLRRWLQEMKPSYLKIVDPFFGPDEVTVLKLIQSVVAECRVYVLTSRKHLESLGLTSQWEEAFRQRWRSISDEIPLETDIAVAGLGSSGKSPIHQRWILTSGAGLELGSSLNSIGLDQDSNVKRLPRSESLAYEQQVDGVLTRKTRSQSGQKLLVTTFSL